MRLPESSTSMYSGQLEKFTTFSELLRSVLTQSVCLVPAVPQAARSPPEPTATAEALRPGGIWKPSLRRSHGSAFSGGIVPVGFIEGQLRPKLPTGQLTLLFADIEGSSRHMAELEDRYGPLVNAVVICERSATFSIVMAWPGSSDVPHRKPGEKAISAPCTVCCAVLIAPRNR